jgi:NADH:ubiquinone oxidoreductase subunit K
MLDLLYLFLASLPIATGLAFVLVAFRERRRAQAVPARPAAPERR